MSEGFDVISPGRFMVRIVLIAVMFAVFATGPLSADIFDAGALSIAVPARLIEGNTLSAVTGGSWDPLTTPCS